MTRLLDDPTIGPALRTDLGTASHRAAYDVEAGLARLAARRQTADPRASALSDPRAITSMTNLITRKDLP